MQKTAVEVGCTYTGEFELLLCSVNIATPLRILRDHTLHPRRDTFLWIFLGIGISSCVPENPQKNIVLPFSAASFSQPGLHVSFFPVHLHGTSRVNSLPPEITRHIVLFFLHEVLHTCAYILPPVL